MSTCVIAEDETLLREALVAELRTAWPELEIVAECADGGSALEAIAAQQPDVAFLDIRMPGLTGLEVAAAALEASPRTQVVFVTAYDQYAVDAFERELAAVVSVPHVAALSSGTAGLGTTAHSALRASSRTMPYR